MIRKAIFPGCYLQRKDTLRNLGEIDELEKKKVFILAPNMAVPSAHAQASYSILASDHQI